MRIAYVCADPGVPVFGSKGCSIHVQEIIRALLKTGAEVDLFATRLDVEQPADFRSVNCHQLPSTKTADSASREQAALQANEFLSEALQRQGPFDVVYERYSLWSFAGMMYARDMQTAGLLEVNAPLIDEQQRHRSLIDTKSALQVAERVFEAADALIAVSEEVGDYLKRFPTTSRRVHVVSNGVNSKRFADDVPASIPKEPETFTIGFVGTLKRWHGLSVLVDAFEKLHRQDESYRLLIVGDGPEREKLTSDLKSRHRGLFDAVRFTGMVAHDAVPGLLASMDVAVAPYPALSDFYFSPLKVYEYMAAGLPVVASQIGELGRLIRDGIDGLLCSPGDASSLVEAITRLRGDRKLLRAMGIAARRTVSEHHTWDAVVNRSFLHAGVILLTSAPCLGPSYSGGNG